MESGSARLIPTLREEAESSVEGAGMGMPFWWNMTFENLPLWCAGGILRATISFLIPSKF